MPVRFLILCLFFSPGLLYAKQELVEEDLELFEFLAMYEEDDAIFIDAEMDEKIDVLTNEIIKTSESDEL